MNQRTQVISQLANYLRLQTKSRNPFDCLASRTIMTVKEIKIFFISPWLVVISNTCLSVVYSPPTAKGPGRSGRLKSNCLELSLATPSSWGSGGKGLQLFVVAYAGKRFSMMLACFLGAIQATAKHLGKEEMTKRAFIRTPRRPV